MNQCTLHFFFHNKTIVPTLKIKKKKKNRKIKSKKANKHETNSHCENHEDYN